MAGVGSFIAWGLGEQDENDDASTTNCPLSCFNGGTCEIRAETNDYYCQCPHLGSSGFMGVHCEVPFSECTDDSDFGNWQCLNGGMCSNTSDEMCHCLDEFGGPKCEIFLGPSDGRFGANSGVLNSGVLEEEIPFSVEAIAVISTLSIVLSFVCFMTGFHVGRKNREPVNFDDLDLDLDLDVESEEYIGAEHYVPNGNEQTPEPPVLPNDAEIM